MVRSCPTRLLLICWTFDVSFFLTTAFLTGLETDLERVPTADVAPLVRSQVDVRGLWLGLGLGGCACAVLFVICIVICCLLQCGFRVG